MPDCSVDPFRHGAKYGVSRPAVEWWKPSKRYDRIRPPGRAWSTLQRETDQKERTGMAQFTIAGAARAAGVGRATIQRALKSGRLSATTNEQGERVIDLTELLRVFGPLKQSEQPASSIASPLDTGGEQGLSAVLVEVLREQLRKAEEREQQAQQEKARLLSLLEAEQQARRELETKRLPAPRPAPTGKGRLWALLVLLAAAALAFAGWHWREVIISTIAF